MNPAVTPLASSQPVSTVARRHLRGSAGNHERFITSRLPGGSLPSEVFCSVTSAADVSIRRALHSRRLPGNDRPAPSRSRGWLQCSRHVSLAMQLRFAGRCVAGALVSIPGEKNGRHRMKRLAIGCACHATRPLHRCRRICNRDECLGRKPADGRRYRLMVKL